MSAAFSTPKQALRLMVDAGAFFAVHPRGDCLTPTFTYRVNDGGDLDRCREIIAVIKTKPAQFSAAFREAVRRHVHEEADQ